MKIISNKRYPHRCGYIWDMQKIIDGQRYQMVAVITGAMLASGRQHAARMLRKARTLMRP